MLKIHLLINDPLFTLTTFNTNPINSTFVLVKFNFLFVLQGAEGLPWRWAEIFRKRKRTHAIWWRGSVLASGCRSVRVWRVDQVDASNLHLDDGGPLKPTPDAPVSWAWSSFSTGNGIHLRRHTSPSRCISPFWWQSNIYNITRPILDHPLCLVCKWAGASRAGNNLINGQQGHLSGSDQDYLLF